MAERDMYDITPPSADDSAVPGSVLEAGTVLEEEVREDWTEEDYEKAIADQKEAKRIERLGALGLPHSVKTAFAVYLNHDGEWHYTSNVAAAADIKLEREANEQDVWFGSMISSKAAEFGLLLYNVTNNVVVNLAARADAAMQQAQGLQIAKQAGLIDEQGLPAQGNRQQRRHPGGR